MYDLGSSWNEKNPIMRFHNDTKRVTIAATVTASGKVLTPSMIFKGAPNGCIATQEFVTYPVAGKYACQPKAWMDETNTFVDRSYLETIQGQE